jgi:hypothetical protein
VDKHFGKEETQIINFIIKSLNQRPKYDAFTKKIGAMFDESSDEFVRELWKRVVFESRKLEEGIVPQE